MKTNTRGARNQADDPPLAIDRQSVKKNGKTAPAAVALEVKLESQFRRQLQVLGVLLILLALLVLLSLISYTPKDEASTELTFNQILGLIRGDELIKSRIDTIYNWLGVLGAMTSNALYNYTIGYFIIFLPFIIFLWARNLILARSLKEKLIKRTILFFLFGTLVAAFLGSLTRAGWFGFIPKEWSGAVGFFLASEVANLTGNIGSFLVFLTAIIVAFMLTVRINLAPLRSAIGRVLEWIGKISGSIGSHIPRRPAAGASTPAPPDAAPEPAFETEEPVRFIRNNLNINIQKTDGYDNNFEYSHGASAGATIGAGSGARYDSPVESEGVSIGLNNTFYSNHGPDSGLNIIDDAQEPRRPQSPDETVPPPPQANGSSQATRGAYLPVIEKIIVEERSPVAAAVAQVLIPDQPVATAEIINPALPEIDAIQSPEPKKPTLTLNIQKDIIPGDDAPAGLREPDELKINHAEAFKPINPLSSSVLDEEIKYYHPTLELLVSTGEERFADDEELRQNARILQEKLETFKIFIEDLSVTPGPVVTQFEFVPAPGIKISKIESFADDMAMALKAPGIRIIAPIPGRGTIGIEIPNKNPSLVRFHSIVASQKFQNTTHKLPMALGKTISGDVFCADLTRMPHLLIAGATGAGKSVGINTLIASLLYKIHPRNLKFVVVDPKKVELRQYSALENHFLAVSPDVDSSIITNPQDAVIALKAVCAEMDLRYDVLARSGQRNILEYNTKVAEGKYKDDKEILHRPMPYIVVIIDELADLMLTAGKEVETPIIRLAQLARAVGIHCVVATQRPSVDVITGIIKANFPARIAYLVASKIDSRTILDGSGAEQLLGNGDMLFQAGGSNKPVRIQNAYISTDEIEDICNYISEQEGYSQPYMLPSLTEKNAGGKDISREDRDAYFEDAARLVIQQQQASVSLLQRRLKVGYARAGRIVDELEAAGVIGPYDGSKARAVFFSSEDELDYVL